jgi:hypothetical protein
VYQGTLARTKDVVLQRAELDEGVFGEHETSEFLVQCNTLR